MHDDGVGLVALDHADVEEAGIFAIHGGGNNSAIAVAVILGGLNHPDARIVESGDEIRQPIGMHRIIGIEHADDFRIGSRARQGEVQGAGFEAFELFHVDKLEAPAESPAVLLHRTPQRGLRRVVDDHNALVIRITQACHRIEREFEHIRRFAARRNMDRHFRCEALAGCHHGREQPTRLRSECDHGKLFQARERHRDQDRQQGKPGPERDSFSSGEIVGVPVSQDGRAPGAGRVS